MFTSEVVGPDEAARPISLEFTNTVQWHASQHPRDTLRTYLDLVAWAGRAGVITDREVRRLSRQARAKPESAQRTLERAIRLREAIYRIFIALIHAKPVQRKDLDQLTAAVQKLEAGARIEPTPSGYIWVWDTGGDDLELFLGRIAVSAANLLLSDRHRWVGQCADDRGCGWLFLDTSKNHSRRWCDMNDCGNRAKQRRLKERRQVRS